jgi:hypothetical protein
MSFFMQPFTCDYTQVSSLSMSSNRHKEAHAITRVSKTLTHSYTLWLRFAEAAGARRKVDCEVCTMGSYGLLAVVTKKIDAPESSSDALDDEIIFAHNKAEYEKAKAESAKWEQRLYGSPLDLTQQNHVAYYRDLVPKFEEWLGNAVK